MVNERILIIIPSFNERENIAQLIEAIFREQPEACVLVVDDSSPDGTAKVVQELQPRFPDRLQLLVRGGKGGRGSAVLEGLRYGLAHSYEYFIEMDADFSHRPEEISALLKRSESCDCVVGSRYLPQSEIREWGWKRTFFSWFANHFAHFVLGIPISDYTNGFRCYRRRAVAALDMDRINAKGYVVLSEIAYQLYGKGMTFGEVPTLFINRRRGISNLTSKEISEAFLSVFRIRFPRLAPHIDQGLKFALSGGVGAVIDLGTLTALVRIAHMRPEWAATCSSFLSLLVVFLMNKFITFRHRKGKASAQILKFGFVYAIAICLNIGLSIFFIRLGVHYFISKMLAIGIVMFYNYFMLHSFVFRRSSSQG